jgi:predicted transcriptional regulator
MTTMTTIKVSAETRDRLKKLADAEQSTMEAALAKVLDEAEEARFWQGVKDDYARLQGDPEQWAGYVTELAEWDRTVSDGVDDLE